MGRIYSSITHGAADKVRRTTNKSTGAASDRHSGYKSNEYVCSGNIKNWGDVDAQLVD